MSEQQLLKRVHFSVMKSLRNFDLDFCPNSVTGIFGENGCGKSTILHTLLCLYKPKSEREDYKFSHFFRHVDSTNWVGSELTAEFNYREGREICNKSIIYKKTLQRWVPQYIRRPDRDVYFIGVRTCVPDIEIVKGSNRLKTSKEPGGIDNVDIIRQKASYILNVDYKELYNRIQYKKNKRYLSVDNQGLRYNSLNMGAGEQRLFKILGVCFNAPKYSLIIIDEIDLTLHTFALNRLLDVLVARAIEKNLQIVFTSHREELLKRSDINIRHIFQTEKQTLCFDKTTSECLKRITGTVTREYDIFVEDDLAEIVVSKVCSDLGVRKNVNIHRFGAIDNAFIACIGLDIANKLTDNILFILDGDRYRTVEERKQQIDKRYGGTEVDKEERRNKVLSHITQFNLPEGVAPEVYIHRILKDMVEEDEVVDIAKQIKVEDETHKYVNAIIAELGVDRQIGLFQIVSVLKKNDGVWNNYTKNIRDWLTERKAKQ